MQDTSWRHSLAPSSSKRSSGQSPPDRSIASSFALLARAPNTHRLHATALVAPACSRRESNVQHLQSSCAPAPGIPRMTCARSCSSADACEPSTDLHLDSPSSSHSACATRTPSSSAAKHSQDARASPSLQVFQTKTKKRSSSRCWQLIARTHALSLRRSCSLSVHFRVADRLIAAILDAQKAARSNSKEATRSLRVLALKPAAAHSMAFAHCSTRRHIHDQLSYSQHCACAACFDLLERRWRAPHASMLLQCAVDQCRERGAPKRSTLWRSP